MSVRMHSRRIVEASMLLRPQAHRNSRLHPKTIQKYIKLTKPLQPLQYKIHKTEPIKFQFPHPQPLKLIQPLPFHIERSTSGNLPVYTQYEAHHLIKRTVIRKITGDIIKFSQQLQKVVSNTQVRVKVGQVIIPGIHKQSVLTWLYKLGF